MENFMILLPYIISILSLIVAILPVIDSIKKPKYAKGGLVDERFKNHKNNPLNRHLGGRD